MAAGQQARSLVSSATVVLRADIGPRLQRMRGVLAGGAERIGLPDQPRQFGQRIALARAHADRTAIMVGVGRKRSVLITISHREDASPSGQRQPAMTTEP